MPLLNGEIAYSSDQRNNSYIFVDLETDLDSANTLMTTSDAAKLGILCKLLAWIRDYLVWASNVRDACLAPLVFEMAPRSQCHAAIYFLLLHDSEASHAFRISTKGHSHPLCIRCAHCNQQRSCAYHPASVMHHK